MRDEMRNLLESIDRTIETVLDMAQVCAELGLDDTQLQDIFLSLWAIESMVKSEQILRNLESSEDISWIFGLSAYRCRGG